MLKRPALQVLGFTGWMVLALGCARTPVRPEAAEDRSPSGAGAQLQASPQGPQERQSKDSGTSQTSQGSPEASADYHFSLAQAYVSEGNPDRAIEEYKLVLAYDPNSALVYARMATEYIKKGSFASAMEACKEALQRDPNFTDARLMLAGLYSTTRATSDALAEYDQILKIKPDHEEAVVYKAQLLIEENRAPEAAKALRALLAKNNESTLGWYYLGKAEQKRDAVKEAIVAYKKALELRPSFSQASLALGYLYESAKMNKEAIAVYRELYDGSQEPTAANRLATILLKEERYAQAVPYLEAIQSSDPDDMNVRVKLGLVHMELKSYEKAISVFEEILKKNPDSDRIHYYLGSLYEETKRPELAMKELRKIQPDSKLYGDAILHVAYMLKQDNRSADAQVLVHEAIAKSPRFPGFHLFLASVQEEAKNVRAAIDVLEGAVKLFPEDEKVRYFLGSLHDRQGDTDKGLEQMEAILRINPLNVDALNYVGYTWTTQGVRLGDAEKLLRKALSLKPDNAYVQDSWGWHLFVRGRVNEAIVQLEKAVRLKPSESTILEHLADAYLKTNLREKAARKYEEAVKFAEDDTARRKLNGKLEQLRSEIAERGTRGKARGTNERLPAGN